MKFKLLIKEILYDANNIRKKIDVRLGLCMGRYKRYHVVEAKSIGKVVDVFKPKTTETIKIMPTYGFIHEGDFTLTYPEIDLFRFDDVVVVGRTDFIIKKDQVVWPKFYNYNFSKNLPRDIIHIASDFEFTIVRQVQPQKEYEVAFSMLGVHAQIWSHSLSEYVTKLREIEKVLELEKGEVVVLCPYYNDEQLERIVYEKLRRHERVRIENVADAEAVKVKRLYYMERPATFTDHENYVAIGDNVQPEIIANIIKEDIVFPLIKDVKDDLYPKKLYLPRPSKVRSLTNNQEVEDFFISQGYYIFEPHKVSLEEKVKLFYNAEVVVGAYGSAFSNLIFCRPGTKALLFSNYQRIFETWLSMHYQHFGIDMLFVTGLDLMKENSSHTSFYIPLEKIKKACEYLGIPTD